MKPRLKLRRAKMQDCRLLWKWANEPEVRASAFDSHFIPYSKHQEWFTKKLRDPNSLILILMNAQNEEIGQVRFEVNRKREAETDISIDQSERNQGYGTNGLKLACKCAFEDLGVKIIRAHIKETNRTSLTVFRKAGFKDAGLVTFKSHSCYEMLLSYTNTEKKYIVATQKPWNIKLFNERLSEFPGTWKLIGDPNKLRFDLVKQFNPRYIFFIHWSNRVPKKIFDNFECVCFHMTDLPYGRGGSPLQNLIVRGHTETVISAIRMIGEIDAGPIYSKRPLSLAGNAEEIFIRAGQIIADMIREIIESKLKPLPQKGNIVKFKRRTPAESRIPENGNLEKAFDWIRMLDAEGYPTAFIVSGKLKIEFKRAILRHNAVEAEARITLNSRMEERK